MRSDLVIVQDSTVAIGKMNTVVKDPNFQTQIIRATDNSISDLTLETADSPQAQIWNNNDTILTVRDTNSRSHLLQFSPNMNKLTPLAPLQNSAAAFAWSSKGNGALFMLLGTEVFKLTFQNINNVWTYQSTAPVCDFKKILPASYIPNWNSVFLHSSDDSTFTVGFSTGGQNRCNLVCVYKAGSNKGYRMLDTLTGLVTGYGLTGKAILTSASGVAFPILLHECFQTPNSTYATLTPIASDTTTGGQLVWDIETLNIVDSSLGGHECHGLVSMFGGGPGGGQLAQAAYSNPTVHTMVVPPNNLPASHGQNYKGDRHFQFGKLDPSDKSIIWSSGYGSPSPYVSAWQDEITGYDTATGKVYRLCHTFAGRSPEFIPDQAIAVGSQTGKYVAWCSTWFNSLGNNSRGFPRGDVFIGKVWGIGTAGE